MSTSEMAGVIELRVTTEQFKVLMVALPVVSYLMLGETELAFEGVDILKQHGMFGELKAVIDSLNPIVRKLEDEGEFDG